MEDTNTTFSRYIAVDKNGLILCIDDTDSKIIRKPIEEITPENVFSLWVYDQEKFKSYLKNFSTFLGTGEFEDILEEDFSFLEVIFVDGKVLLV